MGISIKKITITARCQELVQAIAEIGSKGNGTKLSEPKWMNETELNAYKRQGFKIYDQHNDTLFESVEPSFFDNIPMEI